MNTNVSRKLIADHLVDGAMDVGSEIALKIDQTLAQDATSNLANFGIVPPVFLDPENWGDHPAGGRAPHRIAAERPCRKNLGRG